MKPFLILLFWLTFTGVIPCIAQKKDTLNAQQDSVLHAQLNDQFNLVQRLSAERLADSLKKVELEKQVAGLTSTDRLQKEALIKELAAIKDRDSIRRVRQQQQVDSLRHFVKGYPVVPFLDTLFYVYTRQGSFLPKDRAVAVSKRIHNLGGTYDFKADSVKLVPADQSIDLFYKDVLLLSVSEQDALWAGTSRDSLAAKYKRQIVNAVTVYQKETNWQTLLKQGLLALLVIAVVWLLIYGINRLFKLIVIRTSTEEAWYSRGIRIKNYELLNAARQVQVLHGLFTVIKWLVIILVIYLALPVLFGIFPFTRDISNLLLGYIMSPLKKIALAVWHYIPNLITILIVVVIFRYVLKFIRFIKNEISSNRLTIPGFYADWANPTYQIVRVLILAFMLVVIFPYMPGSNSGIFKGVSVFIGVLFTFGSAGALGNVVAGLVLTYMRAFKIGDRVKIGEVTGDIIGKSLLVTRIRTIQNEVISIPNSNVMNNHTLNYSSEAPLNGLIVHTTVTIGYDVPWRQVHQLLIDAALATDMVEKTPEPYVLQTSLDDYYVSYRINAFTKEPNRQAKIYSSLHANIQDKFNEAGVEIMSPHYKALRDGNPTTIPSDYLPEDYTAPGFNIKNKE
ncbi:mechanosensitive ion channel family protein [Mucilaginibacter segetis]|uniref:Mechanosensitive ion channel family protein n=1 Tax=Mucilaginibacter segetis TaxID=2793071 RepID=A0A934PRQ8_9SPHI|nr:mechanosensitive ion channel family protein [Mucilaginibacter segetis]MBK0378422.1 mechanosensitive ion channel family protein [Mucilaginibacter segetis]